MANTNIKAGMFHGVIGNGPNGYFLKTNGDGSMTWDEAGTPSPTVTSVTYPGDDTAADPTGGQSVTLTGTNFATGATVTIGGTTAPTVSFVSATELTITTPAKAAGDYDIVVTNTDGGTATFVDGISYNGIPSWTTATGSLGTFASDTTISTITLQASEPDAGTITFNITSGALPTGLSLTGADIDGTTSKETADTLYNFTVTAIDDENQSTPRAFSITVEKYIVQAPENFEIVTYTGNGGTQAITSKIGKAASFNGSSSLINLGNNAAINTLPTTISCWINTTTTASESTIWNNGGNSSSNTGLALVILSSGVLRLTTSNSSGSGASVTGTTSINDGNWHHIVITYEAGGASGFTASGNCYLDGDTTPEFTSNVLANFTQANQNFIIGRYWASGLGYLEGKIDQLRIFNTALNLTQVGQLALETYADPKKSTTDYFGDGSGVALYELNENANDTGVTIDSGQSGVFNGSNSYVEILDSNYDVRGNFSLSLWFKLNDLSSIQTLFAKILNTSEKPLTIIVLTDGRLSVGQEGNNSNYGANSTNTVSAGNWYNLVWTADQNFNGKLYINNVLFLTTNPGTVNINNGVPSLIGIMGAPGSVYNGSNQFNGLIDQVRVYSSALSSGDVANLYNETNVPTANLVAHYKLDGNATDETTNYDGTWGGTEAYSDPAIRNYSGTPTNVNFLGMAFQPDLVWLKDRGASYHHILQDSVRGVNSKLASDGTYEENNSAELSLSYGQVTSFDSNGFTLGNGTLQTNTNGNSYVAWCWKAGGSVTPNNNTNGTITSTVSANPNAGFSIVKYTGNNTAGATVGHGLSSTPEMIIIKNLENTVAARNWAVYHSGVDANPENYFLRLNSTIAKLDYDIWNDTAPTSTVFSLGNTTNVGEANDNNNDHIAYCFHSVDGYQKVGSYDGGTITSSNIVSLGFRPRFVLLKTTQTVNDWLIYDTVRDTTNPYQNILYPRTSGVEQVSTNDDYNLYLTDDGFYFNNTNGFINSSASDVIYLAIA